MSALLEPKEIRKRVAIVRAELRSLEHRRSRALKKLSELQDMCGHTKAPVSYATPAGTLFINVCPHCGMQL